VNKNVRTILKKEEEEEWFALGAKEMTNMGGDFVASNPKQAQSDSSGTTLCDKPMDFAFRQYPLPNWVTLKWCPPPTFIGKLSTKFVRF
jgi:hypothetical protein